MGQSVQNGTVGEDYTAGEQLVAELGKNTPGPDFAAKLVAELRKFPRLALVRGSGSEAIANIHENLITVNIYQLEHESLVLSFVEAINKLMGSPVWIPRDPDDVVEEQAAVCVFLAIVGALAAGGAKVNIQLKNDMRSNDQKMLAIEITLTK